MAIAAGAGALVATGGGGDDDPREAFAAKPEGLTERAQAAGLKPGSAHFHPTVRVFVSGEEIPIPDDVGLTSAGEMGGPHRHAGDDKIHAEGVLEGGFTLGQFMAVWGVPFGKDRIGPYRTSGARQVAVLVKDAGAKGFTETSEPTNLRLKDGQEVYITFGTPQESPIVL